MTRLISDILDEPRPQLFHKIEKLERLSGKPGVDIRLTGELKLLFKEKARLLGLDENDTTAGELYFAMSQLALKHSDELAEVIGAKPDDTPRQMVNKAIRFVDKRIGKKSVWSLKDSSARRQLKLNPPKKLMKIFSIRSIDSALKRENVSVFYCYAPLSEPSSWFSKYAAQADKLSISDFDYKPVSISILSDIRRRQLDKAGIRLKHIIYAHQETAGIEIAVPDKRFKGDVLFVVDSILLQIKNIVRLAAFYKSQSLKPDFFTNISRIRSEGLDFMESGDSAIGWPAIVYGATELNIPDLLNDETVLDPEELLVPSLPQLAGFGFWQHPFGAYQESDIVVPFNLSDMIVNAINGTEPARAYKENARKNLKNELFARYLKHEPVRAIVMDIQPKKEK